MKSRSDGTQTVTYDWINNGENRLVGVTTTNGNGTSHQQYIYDASGDRVASIADGVRTNYLVDPMRGVSQVLLEYDANSQITTEYTYGLGLIKSDRSGDENYYHTDGLGSTRVLTNSTGQVVDNYTYDAYGRLLSSTGTSSNSYQFAGEQRDTETGLDYLRARYYDADLGRFISKDSFAGFMDDPMSQNSYQYANANPVNFIDPTGHETMADLSAVFSIIGTLAASTGVGAGAGYLTGAALNGASGEDLLNLTDQWVAGFANTVSFGASTKVRSWLYGEVAEQNHSGFMWNMGQVAGTGVAMILGAATPENLTFSMGRSNWIATTYDAIGTGVGAWQTGTHFREGQLEWSDAFNLLPFAPFAFKGTKQFFGAAMDANGTLRKWGQMGVTSYLQSEYRSYRAGWTSETGAISLGGNSGSNPRILSNDELQQRAKELHNLLADDPQAFKLRTTAVGRIITSEGEAMTAVSSSSGRFSQAQKGAMEEAREIRVPSNSKFQSHAEQNMIEYGQRKGWTIEAIGVSHPEGICPTCHLRMLQGGITPASNLYVGYKGNIPPSAPLP